MNRSNILGLVTGHYLGVGLLSLSRSLGIRETVGKRLSR